MMNSAHVLILSTRADVATDDVVRRLAARGVAHTRLNTEDFPFSRTLAYQPGKGTDWLTCDGEPLAIPTSVWYRRLRSPSRPQEMDDGVYQFCLQENRAAVLGSALGISAQWMSYPAAVWKSEFKPFQLSLASRLGLPIPPTIITNDPAAIRRAFAQFGSMIAKPAKSGYFTCDGQAFSIFTSRVLEQHLEELDSAKWSPAIYQGLIPKRFDVRVTIVGRRVFAAAIDSQSDPSAIIDWRQTTNPHLPHKKIDLPDRIVTLLMRMMDSLGLTFGAIDLIQSTDGEFVFLEINPNGQWLWIDDILDLGISDAVADWLAQPPLL
jgi:glutathione synthase/RimK-type ligase-like ATP-grasp enzyme